jgi:hypothetical protein
MQNTDGARFHGFPKTTTLSSVTYKRPTATWRLAARMPIYRRLSAFIGGPI